MEKEEKELHIWLQNNLPMNMANLRRARYTSLQCRMNHTDPLALEQLSISTKINLAFT